MQSKRDAEAALGCMILAFMALGVALLGFICWAIYTLITSYT